VSISSSEQLYFEKVVILLDKKIQESEKGRSRKPDDVVVVAFDFPDE